MTTQTITKLTTRGVKVPLARPLVTGGGTVTDAPFVLVDIETSEGITGHAYVFCYTPHMTTPLRTLLESLSGVVVGMPLAPLTIEEAVQKVFRLAGPVGVAGWAISGIDMAVWDALARSVELPLARLLGGECRPTPAYNSCGLGIIGAEAAAKEAKELAKLGLAGIKVRLGYPTVEEDAEVVTAVAKTVGPEVAIFTDYNQCLSVTEARGRIDYLLEDQLGIRWVEEPTRWDDYEGHAQIRSSAGIPIQLGENFWGPHDMQKAMNAEAGDLFMPDLGKIGGITGWQRAAALAEPTGLPLSSHLFPEVSAHMLAVTPTRHWLEYVDWAEPILAHPVKLENGCAVPSTTPGSGIEWNEAAIEKFLVK